MQIPIFNYGAIISIGLGEVRILKFYKWRSNDRLSKVWYTVGASELMFDYRSDLITWQIINHNINGTNIAPLIFKKIHFFVALIIS